MEPLLGVMQYIMTFQVVSRNIPVETECFDIKIAARQLLICFHSVVGFIGDLYMSPLLIQTDTQVQEQRILIFLTSAVGASCVVG
jgi:hypothetical protein